MNPRTYPYVGRFIYGNEKGRYYDKRDIWVDCVVLFTKPKTGICLFDSGSKPYKSGTCRTDWLEDKFLLAKLTVEIIK